jgi:hypothetical protein
MDGSPHRGRACRRVILQVAGRHTRNVRRRLGRTRCAAKRGVARVPRRQDVDAWCEEFEARAEVRLGIGGVIRRASYYGKSLRFSLDNIVRLIKRKLETGRVERVSDEKKDELPPFVQNDDSANMIAIRAAQRRRGYGAVLAGGNVIIPPQEPSYHPAPFVQTSLQGAGGLGADASVLSPWEALRAELIPRLDAIEAGLRAIAPVIEGFEAAYREHARIGHNNPPEDIDILPIGLAELELGIVAANLARTEINAEQPRSDVMRFCGLVLRWTGGLLAACVKWVGAKGDVYVDGFLKALGPLTATALAAKLALVDTDITDVVAKIRHVLKVVLHLSF